MNIALIGMSGVGKSIIGKELAKKLNYKFLDIDEVIEKKTKLKLQQIIDNFGDKELLKIEEKTILELDELDRYIISPGGSIIYSEKAMEFLKKNSIVIFLNASLESIKKRVLDFSNRGIIGLKKKGLEMLFIERQSLNEKYADIIMKMPEEFDIKSIVKNIINKIKRRS